MSSLMIVSSVAASIVISILLKKIKKKEILKSPSKYYYLFVAGLNFLTIYMPVFWIKKCFLILLIPLLVYQAFLDKETMELSNILSLLIAAVGILYVLITKQYSNIFTAFILMCIYAVFSLLGPVGFGDVKLVFGLGLFLHNYTSLLFYPFLLSILGELIIRCFKKKKDTVFAFGPYILAGFYVAVFYLEKTLL